MNNVDGYTQSPLQVFGGVVSEVNAFDVPSGSAPIACDVDYTVTSVKTRDGTANVYTYCSQTQSASIALTSGVTPPGNIEFQSYPEICFFTSPSTNAVTVGSPFSGTTNAPIRAGDRGIVCIAAADNVSFPVFGSVTDTLGNSYTPICPLLSFVNGTFKNSLQWYETVFASDVSVGTIITLSLAFSPSATAGGLWALIVVHGIGNLIGSVQEHFLAAPANSITTPITTLAPSFMLSQYSGSGGPGTLPTNFLDMNPERRNFLAAYRDPVTLNLIAPPAPYSVTWTSPSPVIVEIKAMLLGAFALL